MTVSDSPSPAEPADAPEAPVPYEAAPLPRRLARAYRAQVSFRRRAALRAWLAFIVSFILLRVLTYGIRYHFLPFNNVVTGGLHIHHFVWGILLLIVVGFTSLMIDDPRWHPWLAIAFGIGVALVLDEFAIWLTLSDVYWTDQGVISVDVVILVAALLGVYFAGQRFWPTLVTEVRVAIRLAGRGQRSVVRAERRVLRRGRPGPR